MKSLRGKLGLGLAISLTFIMALQWWLASYTLREVTQSYVQSRLQIDVDNLLAGLVFDVDGKAVLNLEQQTYFDERPFSGHYYRIETATTTLRSATLWDQDLNVAPVNVGEKQQLRQIGPLEQPLLILVQGFRKQGQDVSIAVAEDLSLIEANITDFQRDYLLLSTGLLILLLILQTLLLHRALAPVQGVQKDLRRLARGEINSVRENVPEEIRPLVREVNRLLQLLSQRVQRSRRMVGNLAHALKTPLTILTQSARNPALDENPALRQQLEQQTQAIHERLQQELSRARLAGSPNSGARFNPATDLPPLMDVLRHAHAMLDINIQLVNKSIGNWPVEREDMLELLGNLIDNACKWCKSEVQVKLPDTDKLMVIVDDDGPGCPPELRTSMAERGVRLDERKEGHGLGLAIVRDIAEQYQGTLSFSKSRLGGLRVEVVLPLVMDNRDMDNQPHNL